MQARPPETTDVVAPRAFATRHRLHVPHARSGGDGRHLHAHQAAAQLIGRGELDDRAAEDG